MSTQFLGVGDGSGKLVEMPKDAGHFVLMRADGAIDQSDAVRIQCVNIDSITLSDLHRKDAFVAAKINGTLHLLRIRTGAIVHCEHDGKNKSTGVLEEGATYTVTSFGLQNNMDKVQKGRKLSGPIELTKTSELWKVLEEMRSGNRRLSERLKMMDSNHSKVLVKASQFAPHLSLPEVYTMEKREKLQKRINDALVDVNLKSEFSRRMKEKEMDLEDLQPLTAHDREKVFEIIFGDNTKMLSKLLLVDWRSEDCIAYPYEGLFRREQIRGRELVHLTKESFDEMGVRTFGERCQLLHSINRLLVQTMQDEITLSVNWLMFSEGLRTVGDLRAAKPEFWVKCVRSIPTPIASELRERYENTEEVRLCLHVIATSMSYPDPKLFLSLLFTELGEKNALYKHKSIRGYRCIH